MRSHLARWPCKYGIVISGGFLPPWQLWRPCQLVNMSQQYHVSIYEPLAAVIVHYSCRPQEGCRWPVWLVPVVLSPPWQTPMPYRWTHKQTHAFTFYLSQLFLCFYRPPLKADVESLSVFNTQSIYWSQLFNFAGEHFPYMNTISLDISTFD